MKLAKKSLSIGDLRRLGATEIYSPAGIVAIFASKEPRPDQDDKPVDDDVSFTFEQMFSAKTKFLRQLWIARRPGVLPAPLMHRFGLAVAEHAAERLRDEGVLVDIRVTAALAAHRTFVEGEAHGRATERLREAVQQAILDHGEYGDARGAEGCRIVHAALDPDAHEGGAQAAHFYLELFPKKQDEDWLRSSLLELIRSG